MLVLALSLVSAFAPSDADVSAADARVSPGLQFGDHIPAREQTALRESFERALAIACEPPPCVRNCSEDERSVDVYVSGDSRDYTLRWRATDPRLDEPLLLESRCELCSIVDVEDQLASDLAGLCARMDASEGAPGRVRVSAEPERARIRVDGRARGRTPWVGELAPGQHQLQVGARGYGTQTRSLQIFAGLEEVEHFELMAFARTKRPTWPGWTSLGLGVALGLAGTALIALHGKDWAGRCSGSNIDAVGNCRFVYHTRPLGIALAALGAGSFATGVGLIVWAGQAGQAGEAGQAGQADQGVALAWQGRF